MALKNPDAVMASREMFLCRGKKGAVTLRSKCTFTVDPAIVAGDIIDMFAFGTTVGLSVLNWKVWVDGQIDTGAAPTLALRVGCGDPSGLSTSDGLLWANNVITLGRAVGMTVLEPSNLDHLKRHGAGLLVGIQVLTAPQTAAWVGRTIHMTMDVVPTGTY